MSVNKVQLANGETIIDISDSTVTPETLAEGVTAHDASGQKITGKMIPGGGSSVQADWNQTDSSAADFIKNKPVVVMPTGGDTLYWDGNTEGRVTAEATPHVFAHVSDAVPTMDELAKGGSVSFPDGNALGLADFTFNAETIQEVEGIGLMIDIGVVIIVSEPNDYFSVPGTYFGYDIYTDDPAKATYVDGLTINGYTGFAKEQIDPAFLPEPLQFGEESVEEELLAETSLTADETGEVFLDFAPFSNMCDEYIITCDGVTNRYTLTKVGFDMACGNLAVLGLPDAVDTGEPFAFAISEGFGLAEFIFADTNAHTVRVVGVRNVVTPIEPKFLGCDWLAKKEWSSCEVLAETTITIPDTLKVTATSAVNTEKIVTRTRFEKIRIVWNGVEYVRAIMTISQSGVYKVLVIPTGGEPFTNILIEGTTITIEAAQSGNVTVSIDLYDEVPVPMPEGYLPESVDFVIIRSSTKGSTKKFELTVDDSGTITATEVT